MKPLIDSVAQGPGALDRGVRHALVQGDDPPKAMARYVTKLVKHAYKITDQDVRALREAGHSEDQILEMTFAAALGAGLRRLRAGLAALEDGAGGRQTEGHIGLSGKTERSPRQSYRQRYRRPAHRRYW